MRAGEKKYTTEKYEKSFFNSCNFVCYATQYITLF